MNADLYDRLNDQLGQYVDGIYDADLPDGYVLAGPVIVVLEIDDVPTLTIDSQIAILDQRLTIEVHAQDLGQAKLLKRALRTALNGWKSVGGTDPEPIKMCVYENGGPVLKDWDLIPPRYVLPVDFMVTL